MFEPAEILLVEDNPGDARLVFEELEDCRILNHLHTVDTGEAALDYLYGIGRYEGVSKPDIIFLDLNLPKKSGFDVLREMRRRPSMRYIPVVVLTSSKREEDIVNSFDLNVSCFISKPLDLSKILTALSSTDNLYLSITKMPTEERASS